MRTNGGIVTAYCRLLQIGAYRTFSVDTIPRLCCAHGFDANIANVEQLNLNFLLIRVFSRPTQRVNFWSTGSCSKWILPI